MIAALWLAVPGTKQARWLRLGLGVLACITLTPRLHPWMNVPESAFFEPGRVQQVLGENPRILILPFAINGPSSFWQQENDFGFTQTGGYLGFPPNAMQHFTAVDKLDGNTVGPDFDADLVAFCSATKTQYIVAGPGTSVALLSMLRDFLWQERKIDDVTIFTVPDTRHG
jgi:hypothetical protein